MKRSSIKNEGKNLVKNVDNHIFLQIIYQALNQKKKIILEGR